MELAIAFGILLGLTSIMVATHLFPVLEPRISAWWTRGPRNLSDKSFARRMRWALAPAGHTRWIPLAAIFLNPVYLCLLFPGEPRMTALATGATTLVGAAVAYPIVLGKALEGFRLALARQAILRLAGFGAPALARELIFPLARAYQPALRKLAAEGLARMGTEAAAAELTTLMGDSNTEVSTVACEVYTTMVKRIRRQGAVSIAGIEALISEHRRLSHLAGRVALLPKERKELARLELDLRKLVDAQFSITRHLPHVYCAACRTWAVEDKYLDWRWSVCQSCDDATQLLGDVREVRGVIGDKLEMEHVDGVLRYNLWDAERRQPRVGEMDRLEIVGGMDMDYDWAVSATLEALRNRQKTNGKPISLHLLNSPPLSANTMSLLTAFGFAQPVR